MNLNSDTAHDKQVELYYCQNYQACIIDQTMDMVSVVEVSVKQLLDDRLDPESIEWEVCVFAVKKILFSTPGKMVAVMYPLFEL